MRLFEFAGNPQEMIQRNLTEFMPVLKEGLPKPNFKVVNHTKMNYLGMCQWKVFFYPKIKEVKADETTTIFLEKAIFGDENTFRRVLAHELCHHEHDLTVKKDYLDQHGFETFNYVFGNKQQDHGPSWLKIAEKFNVKYGKNFVTATSDASYQIETTNKPFYLLIGYYHDKNYLLQYSITMAGRQLNFVDSIGGFPFKVVTTNNRHLLNNVPRIGSKSWTAIYKDNPYFKVIDDLWNHGNVILHKY
ncbi:SprT-like family protein [uncultured archaeon]|nr:SprT-like family protein [uncultured archaeon]